MGYFSHSIYFLQLHRIYAIVCFAFSSITSVRSSSIVFPFSEKCSFTTIFVFPLLPMPRLLFVFSCLVFTISAITHTPLSVKIFSKQFNGFCHSPQDFHLCIIQCSRTHCVRRSERSSCGCTGVSLSDSTGHSDKRGQVFYKNTDRLSLAFAGERSWRIYFNGLLSV